MDHGNIDRQPLSLDLYRRMLTVDHEERLIRIVGFVVLASIFSAVITFYAFA